MCVGSVKEQRDITVPRTGATINFPSTTRGPFLQSCGSSLAIATAEVTGGEGNGKELLNVGASGANVVRRTSIRSRRQHGRGRQRRNLAGNLGERGGRFVTRSRNV